MAVYDEFARVYSRGEYPEFSRHMGEHLRGVLEQIGVSPKTLLDIACGEGTFAVAMARLGFNITGIDVSPRMLERAREQAAEAGVEIEFTHGDVRTLTFEARFDLVTCWYDSLNYLLESADLDKTFKGVARALKPGGVFIFDMNSLFGLAKVWREAGCYVKKENAGTFEIHRHDYDFETDIGSVMITCFLKENGHWRRFDEEHRERAYPHQEILDMLREAGLQTLASWGSFRDRSEVTPESARIWYISRKGMG